MSLTAVRQEYYSLTDADGIGYTSQPGSPSFIRPHEPPCFASGFLFGTFCTVCGSDTVEVRVTCITVRLAGPKRAAEAPYPWIRDTSLNRVPAALNGRLHLHHGSRHCSTCPGLLLSCLNDHNLSSANQSTYGQLTSVCVLSPNIVSNSDRHL